MWRSNIYHDPPPFPPPLGGGKGGGKIPMNKIKQLGMVDISHKEITKRVAAASATLKMSPKAFKILMTQGSPKGDVFETARVAGVMAAKSTPQVIPFCHPLELSKVNVTFTTDKKKNSVTVRSEVVCQGKTGVEMESLVSAATAALTIYDMMKWADKGMILSTLQLEHKSGGKSGEFRR